MCPKFEKSTRPRGVQVEGLLIIQLTKGHIITRQSNLFVSVLAEAHLFPLWAE